MTAPTPTQPAAVPAYPKQEPLGDEFQHVLDEHRFDLYASDSQAEQTGSAVPRMTPEEINALPEQARDYIHQLETNADPAGMVRENMQLRDTNEGLQRMYRKAADALAAAAPMSAQAPSGLQAQHDRDSQELRDLCESRDQARRERDACKAEIAGLEASCATLGRLVDEVRADGERLEWVLRRCGGSWLRAYLGVANDTGDMAELRVLIDANRGAAPQPPAALPGEQDAALPKHAGIYAWLSGHSAALVLVDKRPTMHAPGGQLNGSVMQSTEFYSGCAVKDWGRDGRWILLHDFDAARAAMAAKGRADGGAA